ncbi:MAG: PAS domain S-box protein [Ignavibacteriaceae bacterium]
MLQNPNGNDSYLDGKDLLINELLLRNRALNFAMNGIVITDPNQTDNPIIFCNKAFEKITGYKACEVIGKNCRFLQGTETLKEDIKIIRDAISKMKECKVVLINYKKDGTKFWNELSISPVFDESGNLKNFIGIQSDITERIEAEATLKRSEQKFRSIIENLDNGIVLTNEEGVIIEWNKKHEEIMGIAAREMLGNYLWDIPNLKMLENYEKVKEDIQNNLTTGEVPKQQLEYIISNPGKPQKIINVKPVAIKTNKGYMLCSIIRDITKQLNDEEEIRKLSRAVETSPSGILLADLQSNIVYINPSIVTMGQYKDETELLGKSIFDFTDDNGKQILDETILPAILSGNKWNGELFVYKKNGQTIPIEISCALVNHDIGQPKYLLAVFNDISERKSAETALKQSEERYRNVVENIKEVIFQTDKNGLWTFLNPAWEEITGFSIKESIGINFLDYVHPEDRERNLQLFEPLINRKKDYCRHTIRYLTKDGGFKWIEVFARLTLDKNGDIAGTSGTLNDVTKRMKAEENIKQSLEKEKELNELKSRFVSTISHEFRTPLTSILGSTQLMLRYNNKWPEAKKQDTLRRIENSVLYMNEMINDVLTLNRAETGKLIFNPSKIEIVSIVLTILEEINLIAGPNHTFITDFSSELIELYADKKLMRHIINNLLSNAVKYSPKGGKVHLSLNKKDKDLEIIIKDEGIGISEEDQTQLFQPFFRGSNIENINGTGLGLSITQRAVNLHNGTLILESKLNKGTTFQINIPLENEKNISN